MKRNGYIDIIKFFFAIVVAEFHLNTGVFTNGRVAVDGFFMISGYLMMRSAAKELNPEENIGTSTVRFLWRKYISLFVILFPSVIFGSIVNAVSRSFSVSEYCKNVPLLIFEIFPLFTAGFKGWYVVGISWYLSSMFIALAILYPFLRKFKDSGLLVVCPLIAIFGYGLLSGFYGNIAIGSTFIEGTIIHTGVVRGLAGCALGSLIFAIHKKIITLELKPFAKASFTVVEIITFILFILGACGCFRGKYDYFTVIATFVMLTIGISGSSYSSVFFNNKRTNFIGVASTLIVLNHYYWLPLLKTLIPDGLKDARFVSIYIGATAVSCVIVYLASKLLRAFASKLSNKKLWYNKNK